jgi:hypothetical protein
MKKCLALLVFTSKMALGGQPEFPVEQLPVGAEVTLPVAVVTTMPLAMRIKLSSTDQTQTIRLVPSANAPVEVSIFDSQMERAKKVRIAPGSPFLYAFRGLTSITIRSDAVSGTAGNGRLHIESDKAFTIAR